MNFTQFEQNNNVASQATEGAPHDGATSPQSETSASHHAATTAQPETTAPQQAHDDGFGFDISTDDYTLTIDVIIAELAELGIEKSSRTVQGWAQDGYIRGIKAGENGTTWFVYPPSWKKYKKDVIKSALKRSRKDDIDNKEDAPQQNDLTHNSAATAPRPENDAAHDVATAPQVENNAPQSDEGELKKKIEQLEKELSEARKNEEDSRVDARVYKQLNGDLREQIKMLYTGGRDEAKMNGALSQEVAQLRSALPAGVDVPSARETVDDTHTTST